MNEINEITVWLDQLEDEGQDVSLMRLLCSYNFLSPFIGDRDVTHFCANTFGNGYAWDYATYWGNGNGNGDKYGGGDVGGGYGDGYFDGDGDKLVGKDRVGYIN